MRGEIVEHDVDLERRRDARVNLTQKRNEVLRPMLWLAAREHFASGDVQRRKEVKRAVADVVGEQVHPRR